MNLAVGGVVGDGVDRDGQSGKFHVVSVSVLVLDNIFTVRDISLQYQYTWCIGTTFTYLNTLHIRHATAGGLF